MDSKIYEEALIEQFADEPMVEKQVLYVQDQNGGSYNGQISIDTTVLSNSGMWNDYSEGYLQIPYNVTLKSSTDITAAGKVNGFTLGLKAGYHHIIDSIQVQYNGKSVIQQQPYTNFHAHYKMMTSWSQDDVKKHGSITGFIPDTAGASNYSNADSVHGDGTCNNVVNPLVAGTIPYELGAISQPITLTNQGYYERLKLCALPATANNVGYGANPNMGADAAGVKSFCNSLGKNYNMDNAGAADARVWQWKFLATIRLKDLHDFFKKMPITKGAYLTMTINYNAFKHTVDVANLAASARGHNVAPTMNSGRTCPIMYSSGSTLNPNTTNLAGAAVLTIAGGIGSSITNYVEAGLLSQCRLYVPSYRLKPEFESQLLKQSPVKKFRYNEIMNYNVLGVASSGSINQILSNGVTNPKALVVIPQMTASAAAAVAVEPHQSIFDSAPGTTSPLAAISQFNVQLAGRNVFQASFQYDFEAFKNEVESACAIDGGSTVGLCNGLLGVFEWDNNYRYYVCDLSRQASLNEGVPQSIVLLGTNLAAKAMNYYCFVEYEKEVEVDMITGQLLRIS